MNERTDIIRQQLEQWGELKPLSSQFMAIIKPHCFITGSYAFFKEGKHTDIDVVLSPECPIGFQQSLADYDEPAGNCRYLHEKEELGIEHYTKFEGFQSSYGVYKDELYNFLFMHKWDSYAKWKFATEEMKASMANRVGAERHNLQTNKKFRVQEFEKYKGAYVP